MRGVDTNILVRLVLIDDERQHALAVQFTERLRARSAPMFVTCIALCELVWALSRIHRLPRDQVSESLQRIVESRLILVEQPSAVLRALRSFESGPADFADYLIGEISLAAGCDDVVTFDRKLGGAEGFTLLG